MNLLEACAVLLHHSPPRPKRKRLGRKLGVRILTLYAEGGEGVWEVGGQGMSCRMKCWDRDGNVTIDIMGGVHRPDCLRQIEGAASSLLGLHPGWQPHSCVTRKVAVSQVRVSVFVYLPRENYNKMPDKISKKKKKKKKKANKLHFISRNYTWKATFM